VEKADQYQERNMNLAIKGALLNAILFPGWGQIYLRNYKKGILIIIASLAGIVSILLSVIQTTIDILKISPFKKGTVTFIAIVQLAIDAIKALNLYYLFLILLFMILLWIFSIIDAYIIGKKEMAKINTFSDQQSVSPQI
jgi:TM2 domain-containing membrane protein YozV